MNRLKQLMVWLSRWKHCRGFGIQSPTDYRFVRQVINERWLYYAYEHLGLNDSWQRRKLGRLYFRLANHLQPGTILDLVGAGDYLQAGCKKARLLTDTDHVEMAVVPIRCDYLELFRHCDERSVVVFQDIYRQMPLWHSIEYNEKVVVSFDLYYCGIVVLDPKRSPHHYKVNF